MPIWDLENDGLSTTDDLDEGMVHFYFPGFYDVNNNLKIGNASTLANLTTGSQNIAIGSNVLNDLLTGVGNLCMNSSAGERITSGHYNIIAGWNAAGLIVTGNGSIRLGYRVTSSSDAGSGKLHLAYDDATNSLVEGGMPNTFLKFACSEVIQRENDGDAGISRKLGNVSAVLSGATTVIQTNIPTGSRLIGVTLRNDTLITGAGVTSYNVAWSGGATQSIATGVALTQNTKTRQFFDRYAATDIASAEVDIAVTAVGGTFSGGTVRAWPIYEEIPLPGDV